MLPSVVLAKAARDIAHFSAEWQGELPTKIHSRTLDHDGSPDLSYEFVQWVSREGTIRQIRNPETRLRMTEAMRTLRKVAPREHDVLYRVFAGETTEQIRDWLNARAIRGGHPERYSLKDAVVLIVSGADKLAVWY